ncbi:MAG: YceI family protein [Cyclobacteriaceae bacterium]|nr:YceI family protein [Cyclobacteriaceae bacterium]
MKKQIIMMTLAVAATGLWAKASDTNDSKLRVNPTESKVEWLGKKVTGEHTGHIDISSGELIIDGGKLSGGTFVIDMSSITNTDIEKSDMNEKLVGHLKSDDFFAVEKYPTSKLVITQVTHEKGSKYQVKGNITIKGITKPIDFPAEVSLAGDKAFASAVITIDRSEFDVKYGSGSFFDGLGDKMIYDDFTLNVSLVAGQ